MAKTQTRINSKNNYDVAHTLQGGVGGSAHGLCGTMPGIPGNPGLPDLPFSPGLPGGPAAPGGPGEQQP